RRRGMLIRSPTAAARAALARGGVDARVSRENDLRAGPTIAICRLFVFAKTELGKRLIDVGQLSIAQEEPGKDNRKLAPAAVPAPARPARMASADHAGEVD